ncbi:MAG TPA: hypothetical protein VJY62_08230 [Bacteroidia bacterium]|nr:hypothetical protein [Bacteroidia bacterium]
MPCKGGIECLKEIRNINKLDKVPVIIFSTSSFKIDIEETFNKGMNRKVYGNVMKESL